MARFVESTITFPYKRSLGPVIGAFMTALTEQRILGIRSGDGVLVPPLEWDPATGAELAPRLRRGRPGRHGRVVDLGAGSRPSSTRSTTPSPSPSSGSTAPTRRCCTRSTPARPTPWRRGCGWRPGGGAPGSATSPTSTLRPRRGARDRRRRRRPGRGAGDDDGLQRLDHLPQPGPGRSRPGGRGGPRAPVPRAPLPGLRSAPTPAAGATARSTRSSSGAEHEVDLPQTGTITNYTIITPVQYPGQTETEPFARVFVLLDGTDVVARLPAGDRPAGRRGARRPAGRRGVGLAGRGRPTRAAAWAAPRATCSAGCPPASPTSTTPTS